jgi:hypothetical protein
MWTVIAAIAAVTIIPITIWGVFYGIRAQRSTDGHLDYELVSGTQLVASEASRLSGK